MIVTRRRSGPETSGGRRPVAPARRAMGSPWALASAAKSRRGALRRWPIEADAKAGQVVGGQLGQRMSPSMSLVAKRRRVWSSPNPRSSRRCRWPCRLYSLGARPRVRQMRASSPTRRDAEQLAELAVVGVGQGRFNSESILVLRCDRAAGRTARHRPPVRGGLAVAGIRRRGGGRPG